MPESLKKLRIFAASPSDVASERAKLETVVDSLKPMADYLGLTLEVVDWRAVVPDAGRPQQVIFDQLKPTSWDIFVGILWHRFGTPPGAKDKGDKDYLSGTEEEFKTAYKLWKQHRKPRMVLYRCTRALPFDVDSDQLKRVRKFFKLIENVKSDYPTLYQVFETAESFEKLALNNLQKLLVEYSEESKKPITPEVEQGLTPKIPNNLPRRQLFFGRAKELETVMRALSPDDRTWGVLVDGIGGIGKSAIAIEAAYRTQEQGLFDAFVFVTAKTIILDPSGIKELNPPARTLDEFLNETAHLLGQPGIAKLASHGKRRALIDVLRSVRTLLIYDNLETLSKEEQEGIADFLRELPQGCKAIITSRRRGGEGGVWLRVEKLDWDAARGIIENEISREALLASKLNRVGKTRWHELFDETNGSPLALVHTLGLMRVRAALTFDGALEMLRGNRDEDLQNFIFQEARKELTENDRTALGALSFFTPSATFEAWMEVAELTRNALESTIDRLSALSLVDVSVGEEGFSLHPLTRAFVRDQLLSDVNVTQETGKRFAEYWIEYAKRHGGGSKKYKTFNFLEAEWANLNAAANLLREALDLEDASVQNEEVMQMLNELILGVEDYLYFSGRWDEGEQLIVQAYEIACAINEWDNALAHAWTIVQILLGHGDSDGAGEWEKRALDLWVRAESTYEPDRAKAIQDLLFSEAKDFENKQFTKQMLISWRGLGDNAYVSFLIYLAILCKNRKDYKACDKYYREALEISKNTDDIENMARSCIGLGESAFLREEITAARKWFEQATSVLLEVNNIQLIADANYGFARVREAEGRIDLAFPLAQEALNIYERLQHADLVELRKFMERLKESKGRKSKRGTKLAP